jgi:hypothetical protein
LARRGGTDCEDIPDIEALPGSAADIPIVLGEEFDASGSLVFTINGKTFPEVPPVMVETGGVHVMSVKNDSDMDHPFHLQGFFFQRLNVAGKPRNKDTIIVKAHETLELASRFDEQSRPGLRDPAAFRLRASHRASLRAR